MMSPEIDYKIIRDVECLNNNQIWVGTQSGLYIVDELKNQVLHFYRRYYQPTCFISQHYWYYLPGS